jgi:hypothetical protein
MVSLTSRPLLPSVKRDLGTSQINGVVAPESVWTRQWREKSVPLGNRTRFSGYPARTLVTVLTEPRGSPSNHGSRGYDVANPVKRIMSYLDTVIFTRSLHTSVPVIHLRSYWSSSDEIWYRNFSTTCRIVRNSTHKRSRDSTVGIATGYGLDGRVGVRVPVGARWFSTPRRPDRFWGPPSLLFNWYRELFPRG